MELVIVNNGVATTTTLAIAEGTGNEHKAVIQLVRNYLSDLEQFGRVTFEMAPFETAGGTQTREIANLNERQATLIMSYMKNTAIIRKFKTQLVKSFYELAEQVNTTLPVIHDPKTQALIQALVQLDAHEHEIKNHTLQIADINGKLDDMAPAMTSQTLFTIYGRIGQVAKVYREVMELNRRKITAAVAKQDITAELLCKFDIHDLAYAKDTKSLFRYLDNREKQLVAEREELWPAEGLFKKAA